MIYRIIKLSFSGMVHFGTGQLESSECTFSADTLFSALCCEIINQGNELTDFKNDVCGHKIMFSDAFPYDSEALYLPKPCCHIVSRNDNNGDSVQKKLFKKLRYITTGDMRDYIAGRLTPERAKKCAAAYSNICCSGLRQNVSIRTNSDPEPYSTGFCRFNDGCGLYFAAAAESDGLMDKFIKLLGSLSYSGIGGKRTAGYGRFTVSVEKPDENFGKILENAEKYKKKMSISISLPDKNEMEEALKNASYTVIKRSGFVQSDTYSDRPMKKNDLYMLRSGACFENTFQGNVYDVSGSGSHPVYRCGIPMFIGLEEAQ